MEAPVIWIDPSTGERWRREGYCCLCGMCCGGNPIPDELPDAPHGMCPLWQATETGGICTNLTHPYRLKACAHFPSKPDHILPYERCTYRFVREDTS